MEKSYPATFVKRISQHALIYEDENGIENTISLLKCRDKWYENHYGKESLKDKILKRRKKCKYVGDRFWGYDEAYIIFYSDILVKFFFDLNENIISDHTSEARKCFGYIKEQLRNAGWLSFDIG